MLVHILISLLAGLVAYWIAGALHARHEVAVIIGLIVGVLVYLGALGL